MTAATTTANGLHSGPMKLASALARRPLLVALAITAVITAARMTGTVDSDVAWQLWIAGRIHAGAQLYRDIIEVNPPLWFWLALPIDTIATFLHARVEAVLTVAMGLASALSLAATNRFLTGFSPERRTLFLAYAALTLMAMPWAHVGQREQIVLLGALPYAALLAARREAKPVPMLLATLIGIGAALGFALKHYFLIVPAALELWLIAGQGRDWRWRRPETLAILCMGAVYACAILISARGFLTSIVPLASLAYGMLKPPSALFLFGPFALVGLATFAVAATHARLATGDEAPLTWALLVAAAGFAAVYFVQSKGWTYHAIPLLGFAALALAAQLAESSAPRPFLRLSAPALLALPLFLSANAARHPGLPTPDLENAIAELQPGDAVGFLAVETAVPWSVTLQHHLRYPSRYMGYWMLNAIVGNEHRANPDPRLTELGRQIVSETVADLRCVPPKRIIVSRPRPGEGGFDILPFFKRDPAFAELFSHYRSIGRTTFDVYQLKDAVSPLPASQCRRGV